MIHNTKLSLIAAMSENRVIGRDNRLLWRIFEDLKRFKNLTSGHPVIMGRKTYESIGKLLPNRTNIIITRDPNYSVEGAVIAHSLEEALQQAQGAEGCDEIFIIGGGQIYSQAIGMADKLYITVVHTSSTGDAYFPDYSEFKKVISQKEGSEGGISYTFFDLEK